MLRSHRPHTQINCKKIKGINVTGKNPKTLGENIELCIFQGRFLKQDIKHHLSQKIIFFVKLHTRRKPLQEISIKNNKGAGCGGSHLSF
jgi:polynucleotide 5'-kinase involved in rRNA processing